MEGKRKESLPKMRYHSQATAGHLISRLISNAHQIVHEKEVEIRVHNKLPESYLGYVDVMSSQAKGHQQPIQQSQMQKRMITEPVQMCSSMNNPHFKYSPYIQRVKPLSSIKSIGRSKKQIRISQRIQSKRLLYSRRMIQSKQPPKLISLPKTPRLRPEKEDEVISQLRSKKVKLEQAFRFFMQEEMNQSVAQEQKQTKMKIVNNFTTDYRGKIININPKVSKPKETSIYNIRVQTQIDSCRPEGRINLSKRGGNRQLLQQITNVSNKWL